MEEIKREALATARAGFSRLLEEVAAGKRVVIQNHNRDVAALVPLEDLKTLSASAKRRSKD